MDDASLSRAVIREISELHDVFQAWFRGTGPDNLDRLEAVLDEAFTLVGPDGALIDHPQLLQGLLAARGSLQVRIDIEDPKVVWYSDRAVLAKYVEVQHDNDHTTRRRSSALFLRTDGAPNGLVWSHVHETWIDAPNL